MGARYVRAVQRATMPGNRRHTHTRRRQLLGRSAAPSPTPARSRAAVTPDAQIPQSRPCYAWPALLSPFLPLPAGRSRALAFGSRSPVSLRSTLARCRSLPLSFPIGGRNDEEERRRRSCLPITSPVADFPPAARLPLLPCPSLPRITKQSKPPAISGSRSSKLVFPARSTAILTPPPMTPYHDTGSTEGRLPRLPRRTPT